jgi:hypothetical protein
MTALDLVRAIIDTAPIVPPGIEPFAEPAPEPLRLRKLPIALLGIGQGGDGKHLTEDGRIVHTGIADPIFLYEDINGVLRALGIGSHDHSGIRALLSGEEWRLPQLWPGRLHRWSPVKAAEELIGRQGHIGVVRLPAGVTSAETLDTRRFRAELGRLVRRMLTHRNPHLAHQLAQAWNREAPSPRPATEVTAIVNAVCGAVLRAEGTTHGRGR